MLPLSPFYGGQIIRAIQYNILRSPGWQMANQEDKKSSLFPTSEILILITHIKGTVFLAPMYSSFSLYGLIMIFPLW